MILSLGTLVLLLLKDTMGSLQQNTVLNGTSLVLTWNIRMPAGKSFLTFKIYEGSAVRELAIIKKESSSIENPDRLKGRVFNESSDINTVPMVFRLKIGPVTMEDDGLVIIYQVLDTDTRIAVTGQDSIKVTKTPIKPPSGGDGDGDGGLSGGAIAGIVIGVILGVILIAVVVYFVLQWKNAPLKTSESERMAAIEKKEHHDDGTLYASTSDAVPHTNEPVKPVYSALGGAGGRVGPRDEPQRSNYAEVKTDKDGYPSSGRRAPEKPERGVERTNSDEEYDGDYADGLIV